MRKYLSTNGGKNQAVKITRADGRIVGEVRGDTFYKRIHDAHFLTTPRGIASDVDALRQAERAGARFFCAHHVEANRDYIAPIARFFSRGVKVNRGYDPQLALVILDFNTADYTPTAHNKPVQPSLFNLNCLRR